MSLSLSLSLSLYIYIVIFSIFSFLTLSVFFDFVYGVWEAPEVSKNLPGARSSVLTEYEPIPSHGDPIHARNDLNFVSQITYVVQLSRIF